MVRDLYGHQAWADAEQWRAIGAHLAAAGDRAIRESAPCPAAITAARMRLGLHELGGEPPMTDLIVWYWNGRPAPAWD